MSSYVLSCPLLSTCVSYRGSHCGCHCQSSLQSEELKFQQEETAVLQRDKKAVEEQNRRMARELELCVSKEKEYAAICSRRAKDNKEMSAKVLCCVCLCEGL